MKKSSKIKKIRLPLKKMTEKEKDYVAAVLEDVNHNFKAFGEVLEGVRKKSDATFEEVGRINERLTSVEMSQTLMRRDTKTMQGDIKELKITTARIEQEIISIKNEIKDLRLSLSKKADIERLEKIELRIVQIEKHLKLAY